MKNLEKIKEIVARKVYFSIDVSKLRSDTIETQYCIE